MLATQCLVQSKPARCGSATRATPVRRHRQGPHSRDDRPDRHRRRVGHVIEYSRPAISALSMEGRMTVCNMTIEGGGRAGMIAPDDGLRLVRADGAARAPPAPISPRQSRAGASCPATPAPGSTARSSSTSRRSRRKSPGGPPRGWSSGRGSVPPAELAARRPRARRAGPEYMGLRPASRSRRSGSTASSSARAPTRGSKTCAPPPSVSGPPGRRPVRAMVVPGSGRSKRRPRKKGWTASSRPPASSGASAGCSMCLGMNPDKLSPGERCASTSNRNFEGRQGKGGRTHLVSPAMAAAAAIEGHFVDIREWKPRWSRSP